MTRSVEGMFRFLSLGAGVQSSYLQEPPHAT